MKFIFCFIIIIIIFLITALVIFPEQSNKYVSTEFENILDFYRVESGNVQFLMREEINNAISEIDMNRLNLFYLQYTRNETINKYIIEYSLENNIPIHVSFAIAWKESQFNHRAISPINKNNSRDWGLFQLNDSYRRNWTRNDFFDIRKNTHEGISYFKWCLNQTGDIIYALKAYNAGINRVKSGHIPETTILYVEHILEYESLLDEEWNKLFGNI